MKFNPSQNPMLISLALRYITVLLPPILVLFPFPLVSAVFKLLLFATYGGVRRLNSTNRE
jgi:hypothetical protein